MCVCCVCVVGWVGVIGLSSCVCKNRGFLERMGIGDIGTSGTFIVSCGAFMVKCEEVMVRVEGGGEVSVICVEVGECVGERGLGS